MIRGHRVRDDFVEWNEGCVAGLSSANVAALKPGTTVSSHCRDILYSTPGPGVGRLSSVTLTITPLQMNVTFRASQPWSTIAVARSDGNAQWDVTEWVPHHRPIINDNHGGTRFPSRAIEKQSGPTPSPYVFFTNYNRTIHGTYKASGTMVVITFEVADMRVLGIHTPFTWVGSEGLEQCSAATAS